MSDEGPGKGRRRRRRRRSGAAPSSGDGPRPEMAQASGEGGPAADGRRKRAGRRRGRRDSAAPSDRPREARDPRPSREPREAREPRSRRREPDRGPRASEAKPELAERSPWVDDALPSRADSFSDDLDADDERFVADEDEGEGEDAQPVTLGPDLPPDQRDDPDPSTAEGAQPFEASGVADVVGVKFNSAGKIYLYDSGRECYARGESIMVESDRGPRWGMVALATRREMASRKGMKRVLRRPSEDDQRARHAALAQGDEMIHRAKDIAKRHELPIKVFRCEVEDGGRVVVHFSCESKVDARPLVRDLAGELGCRVDTRQTGVRDEAKMVGGIGSCGQELCCTTWLPAFVPVSIKNAKDQGLVLNPTKVAGQCGRLKCCLVYEHATYAEMRKGLPKLGKRVVTEDGEGRVVEVDVLRQRIRVSLVDGPVKVFGKGEVEPLFPSQQGRRPEPDTE